MAPCLFSRLGINDLSNFSQISKERSRNVHPSQLTLRHFRTLGLLACMLVSAFSHSENAEIPANATKAEFGNRWTCNAGYRKEQQACVKIAVPSNAHLTYRSFGDPWACNRGFRKQGDTCRQILLPANAYLTSPAGDDWKCHRGYRKQGPQCDLIDVPEHAFLNDSTFGAGWTCERGFREVDGRCDPVLIPDRAHLDNSGDGWQCDPPYRRRQESCVAP